MRSLLRNAIGSLLLVGISVFGAFVVDVINPQQASAVELVKSTLGDPNRHISLSSYANYKSSVAWPSSSTCSPSRTTPETKPIPWQPANGGTGAAQVFDGDSLSQTGDCQTRYTDSGSGSGIWLPSTQFSWGTDGSTFTSTGSAVDSNSNTSSCPAGAARIWPNSGDNSEHSDSLYASNGNSGYSPSTYGLYSHGVGLFKKTFTINGAPSNAQLVISGDDFYRVYVNGTLITTRSSVSSSASTITTSTLNGALRNGENYISVMVIDKALWLTSATQSPRGKGVCYTLNADVSAVYPTPAVYATPPYPTPPTSPPTCTLSANPSSISSGQSSLLSWTSTNSPTSASISPAPGSVTPAAGGSVSVSPTTNTNYTLTVSNAGGSNTCTTTVSFVSRPYLRVYGGDVQVGTSLVTGCPAIPANNAKILTFNLGSTGWQGAGTQMAAFALGSISGFTSSNASSGAKWLSFSNTAGDSTYGGAFGKTTCAPDYWADATSSVASYNVPASGYTVNIGTETTVYVNGNAILEGNIIYDGSGAWANLDVIPSYTLVVRGNIYIGRNVTQLDGTFIALPNGSGGGTIYTCANGSSPYGGGGTFTASECNNTLTVNGSFIAEDIRFTRTRGTLNSPDIAEIFRFGPEVWVR